MQYMYTAKYVFQLNLQNILKPRIIIYVYKETTHTRICN